MKISPWPEVCFCGRQDRPLKLFVYKYGTYLTEQKNESNEYHCVLLWIATTNLQVCTSWYEVCYV